jgi:hypothetical protein
MLDFPNAPTLNQKYPQPPVSGQPVYTWDGEKWTTIGGSPGTGGFVRYDVAQGLTDPQQVQARQNVYAAPLDALAYNGMQTNGSMDVDQEHGGAAVANLNGAETYICDGFSVNFNGAPVGSAQQVADAPPGLSSSLKLTVTTAQPALAAGDIVYVQHKIEGYRTARLMMGNAAARPISIGFFSKIHRPGTYAGAIVNSASNRSYAFSFTQNVADAWEFKTVTIPGDVAGSWIGATNGIGLRIYWCMAAGSSFVGPANTWVAALQVGVPGMINGVAATTDTFQITGVIVLPGVELPSAARAPLIMRPFDQELFTCQRYFFRDVLDGLNINSNSYQSGAIIGFLYRFPRRMRAVPTISASWPTVAYSSMAYTTFDSATVDQARLLFSTNSVTLNCSTQWGAGGNNYNQGDARL